MRGVAGAEAVRWTPKRKAWWEAYWGQAARDGVAAAVLAGLSEPHKVGRKLERNLSVAIELRDAELRAAAEVQPSEVIAKLSIVARNIEHKDHVRALELLARIHGMISDKLNVKVDKQQLLKELDEEIRRIAAAAS